VHKHAKRSLGVTSDTGKQFPSMPNRHLREPGAARFPTGRDGIADALVQLRGLR
jgi:hypothetical protein